MNLKSLFLNLVFCVNFASAGASEPIAQLTVSTSASSFKSVKDEVLGLYKTEASNAESKLSKILEKLKKENEGFEISNEITENDILVLDSGRSGPSFSTEYLITVKGGYKSSTSVLKYLKASSVTSDEGETYTIRIDAEAKVSIK